jgi:16S rRNA (guanine527-N7)-methyltransferase
MNKTIVPFNQEIWQETLGWTPNNEQQTNLQELYQHIIEGNHQLNLTRITDNEEFWEKHLWDSLAGVIQKDQIIETNHNLKVIDIGTGGGFPGLPLAIIFPHWQINLLDSTTKKMVFIESILPQLKLSNVKTLIARAEDLGQDKTHRQKYDLACIRAVAEVNVCAEYVLPLLKIGGKGILYRGQLTQEETTILTKACELLGGKITKINSFTTPLSKGIRHCIYLEKIKPTNSLYPRKVGIPKQQPLE